MKGDENADVTKAPFPFTLWDNPMYMGFMKKLMRGIVPRLLVGAALFSFLGWATAPFSVWASGYLYFAAFPVLSGLAAAITTMCILMAILPFVIAVVMFLAFVMLLAAAYTIGLEQRVLGLLK